MSNIDISKIKPGDTVRYSFQDGFMEELGIKPKEGTSQVYEHMMNPFSFYVDGYGLQRHGLTILEHIPARPEWAGAQVIRVNEAERLEAFGVLRTQGDYLFPYVRLSVGQLEELDNAEITVVLDKDGNAPKPEEPEIEWLNEEDLNKLPPCSVVKPRVLSRPRTKGFDGRWYAGESLVDTSSYIAPARVIYIPEGN